MFVHKGVVVAPGVRCYLYVYVKILPKFIYSLEDWFSTTGSLADKPIEKL